MLEHDEVDVPENLLEGLCAHVTIGVASSAEREREE